VKDFIGTFNALSRRVSRSLGIQGDGYPGATLGGLQPVVVSENLTDQRSLFLKGGASWEASFPIPIDGANYPTLLLRPRAFPVDGVQMAVRVKRLTVWSEGGSGLFAGWKVWNDGSVPAFVGASNALPGICRDSRQNAGSSSLYNAVIGVCGVGPDPSLGDWARMPGPPCNGGPGNAVVPFDPQITLLYPDVLQISSYPLGYTFGISIGWEEHPVSEQELARR